jgi:hypothetical protein
LLAYVPATPQLDQPSARVIAPNSPNYSVSPPHSLPRRPLPPASQTSGISNQSSLNLDHTQHKHQTTHSRISKHRPNTDGTIRPPPINPNPSNPNEASGGQEVMRRPYIFAQGEQSRSPSQSNMFRAPSSHDDTTDDLIPGPVSVRASIFIGSSNLATNTDYRCTTLQEKVAEHRTLVSVECISNQRLRVS